MTLATAAHIRALPVRGEAAGVSSERLPLSLLRPNPEAIASL